MAGKTPDVSNVIEVEFPRRPQTTAEIVLDVLERLDKVSDLAKLIDEEREECWRLGVGWRDYARHLERELTAERRARFPVDEGDVLAALRVVSTGGPVRARVVAAAMFPADTPSHSVVIRVGQALGRLSRAGKACRIERRGHEHWAERYGYEWEAASDA